MKLKLFWGLALIFLAMPSFAQNADDSPILIAADQQVSVYYVPATCGPKNVVFVNIVNENTVPVTVTWSLWDDAKTKSLEVQPGQMVSGACQNRQPMFMLTEEIPAGKTVNDMRPAVKISVN